MQTRKVMPLLAIAVLLAFALHALAKPERPLKSELPNLEGASNWGEVTQNGRNLTLDGHPSWFASGRIFPDNKRVRLLWVHRDDGRVGPAVYRIEGDNLVGAWGWIDEVRVEEDGTLTGNARDDTVWIKKR